jgi:hypothetical protein
MADLVDAIFYPEDWHQMREYLTLIQKPRLMSPKNFLMQTRHIETLTLSLHQAPATLFNDNERKRNFLQAHHFSYRIKFDEANLSVPRRQNAPRHQQIFSKDLEPRK